MCPGLTSPTNAQSFGGGQMDTLFCRWVYTITESKHRDPIVRGQLCAQRGPQHLALVNVYLFF